MTAATGGSAAAPGSPALTAQEHLQREQRPQRVPVAARAGHVLADDALQRALVEVVADARAVAEEHALRVGAQVRAEPAVERDAEAPLAAGQDLRGQDRPHRVAQHALEREPACLEARAQPRGELDELVVEERRAYLEP